MSKKKGDMLQFTSRATGAAVYVAPDNKPESIVEVLDPAPHETPGDKVRREAAQIPAPKPTPVGTDFVCNGKNHQVRELTDEVFEAFGLNKPAEDNG